MIDDKTLREVLQRKISQIKQYPRSAQKEVENIMSIKFNVNYGTTVEIFNGLLPVETLSYDMLYKLMISVHDMIINNERYEQLDANDLYAPKYFTEYEIEEFKKPLEKNDEDIDMVFENWLQVSHDQYVCVVPIEQIVEWRNLNKIKYNHNTQRELTEKTTKGGVVVKVVTIFETALKAIKKLMLKDDFIPDDITFNTNPDFYEEPKIKHGKLIVSVADIIDGFHRYTSMCDVKDRNPNWKFNCIINVMVFNEEKAQRYMIQKDKKNHLSPKQLVKIDKNNESNYVISRLNESSSFHHRSKIDDDSFVMLVKLVADLFNPQERQEAVELSKLIEKNINEIIEIKNLYDEGFSKHEWFIYLYLLKLSDCNSNTFSNIINKIDMDYLLSKINFRNDPTKGNYKIIDTVFGEVK